MNKLLVICGPTATGKTELGIKLAQTFGGEIVSADSRQVYRGMTIGTGKEVGDGKWEVSREARCGKWVVNGVPVWLMDVVEPDYRFNVGDYKKYADEVLENIWKRGKLPIVVGGTGFYIKALLDGIGTIGVEPDWKLRRILSTKNIKILGAELAKIDAERWEKMNESDRNNPRRLIRAIEIAKKIQNPKSKIQNYNSKLKIDNLLIVGLKAPYRVLYERIDKRVEERVKQGIIEEIQKLIEKGYNWENSVLGSTLGYREWKDYFAGKLTKEEVICRWKFDEHNYARRQMTWFKKDPRINWFDITQEGWQTEVENLVKSWYSKANN